MLRFINDAWPDSFEWLANIVCFRYLPPADSLLSAQLDWICAERLLDNLKQALYRGGVSEESLEVRFSSAQRDADTIR